MPPATRIPLNIGIYSRADAARLLGVTQPRLRRWVSGYTYLSHYRRPGERRSRPPVIRTDLPLIDDTWALSFLELMELRVVKKLVDRGLSLQKVRARADLCAKEFGTMHPFASRRVFTDGAEVFAAVSADETPDVVELRQGRQRQVISDEVFRPFLEEIDFDPSTQHAYRWWPMGRSWPVILNPRVAFGAPVVQGTALRTATAARMALAVPLEQVAEAFELPVRSVEAAVEFERQLAAA